MKTFKVMIAMAAITFCGSISMAISAEQREICLGIMVSKSLPAHQGITQDQVALLRSACNSSMMNYGQEYAGCMLQLQRSGIPVHSNPVAYNQKAVTGAALCSQNTNFELNTCIANRVIEYKNAGHSDAYLVGQQAAIDCRQLAPDLIPNPLTNGTSFSQTMSNEEIRQEADRDLKLNYGGRSSGYTAPRQQQPAQESQPTYESQPASGTVYTDLPEVE